MSSQAAQALGRGRQITLTNGDTYKIIFSLYTLAVIEDELGSLDAIDEVFSKGGKGKMVRTVGKMLANALCDGQGNPVEIEENTLLKLIPLDAIAVVFQDVQAGLNESFRQAPAAAATTVDTAAIQNKIAAMAETPSSSLGNHFSTAGASSSDSVAQIFGD